MNPYGDKNIAGKIWDITEPVADSLGYYIWNIEYVREGADMCLKITIDSDEGVDIDDCEKFSRTIDELLDNSDVIPDQYLLEVSSPGLERDLVHDFHFEKYMGQMITLKLYKPYEGKKQIDGVLEAKGADALVIECEGEMVTFGMKDIAKVNAYFDWASDM